MCQIFNLPCKSIGKASKSSHVHAHCTVLVFSKTGIDMLGLFVTNYVFSVFILCIQMDRNGGGILWGSTVYFD